MASVKVLLFLFGSMLILIQFHKSSAASLVENLDAEDETLDDKEGVTKKDETFDVTEFEAKDDLNGLEDVDKRRACANLGSRRFCRMFMGYCKRNNSKGRIMRSKCRFSCHIC